MDRYKCEHIPSVGGVSELTDAETHHLVGVRRKNVGDVITVFDGAGGLARAEILSVEDNIAMLKITELLEAENSRLQVVVATGIPKGSRMNSLVRALTEVGASEVWPMITSRSVVKPPVGKLLTKQQKVAEAASKQSLRAIEPCVAPVMSFKDVTARAGEFDLAIIADAFGEPSSFAEVLAKNAGADGEEKTEASKKRVVLLIGPEGGFTKDEIKSAVQSGFSAAQYPGPVMRVETAAPVLVGIIISQLTSELV